MIRSVGLTAALALAANAFMIPSTMSAPDVDLAALNPAQYLHDNSAKIVKLPCPGCSFEGAHGTEHTENDMVLTWSLSDDHKALLLNGQSFYGSPLSGWSPSFPVSQVPASTSVDDIRQHFDDVATRPRDMFYQVLERFTHAADGTEAQLIDIDFAVNSLGAEQVHGSDRVTLRVLKDEQGRLAISDVVQVPADNSKPAHDHEEDKSANEEEKTFNILPIGHHAPPAVPSEHHAKCEGRMAGLCRLKAMMRHRFGMLRNALHATGHRLRIIFIGHPHHHGMRPHHRPCKGAHRHGVPSVKGGVPKFWRLGRPAAAVNPADGQHDAHHHAAHGPHGHGRGRCQRMRRFLGTMRRVFLGFIVPVLIGIAAGLSASLLGMLVGTGVAMFWIRCVRGGRRGNASAKHEDAREEATMDGEEKIGLMADEDAEQEHLPAYEDSPAYEDKQTQH